MLIKKVKTAKTGNDSASCFHVSKPSHHRTKRGGGLGGSCFNSGGATGLCPLDDLVEEGDDLLGPVDHYVAAIE